jgi:hypothetical protein
MPASSRRDAMRALQVRRPYGGGKAVVSVVRQADRLSSCQGRDVAARSEDLLAHDRGGFAQTRPDGRLHPGAGRSSLPSPDPAAGHDAGAVIARFLVVAEHLAAMLLADGGPMRVAASGAG